jgi:hypothetical protein
MAADAEAFLERWHRIVAERDLPALAEILSDDVEMGAPPYWARLRGRDLVAHLLGLVVHTIEGFTYRREWVRGPELALEFTGRVGGLDLQGVDLISLDEAGRLRCIEVPMRPSNAVAELQRRIAPRMQEWLAGGAQA